MVGRVWLGCTFFLSGSLYKSQCLTSAWLQVKLAESRTKELQEELTETYREKSRLAEELVAASRQLQIVRDSNEAQVRRNRTWSGSGDLHVVASTAQPSGPFVWHTVIFQPVACTRVSLV